MRKSVMFLLAGFIVLGIVMNSFYVLADDNSNFISPNGPGALLAGNSPSVDAGPNSEGQGSSVQEREQERIQQHIEGEYQVNGTHVHVSREIQVENGTVSVQITKDITYANGSQSSYTIQINTGNQSGAAVRTMNMEREGENFNVSIGKGFEVGDTFIGNKSQIIANLSNGEVANITVLPDQAMKIALERLRIRNQIVNNGTNFSIQLQEKVHNNIPQVVYNIETGKPGKFLGVFKMNMKVSTEVDSQTGNVVSVSQPWWAFLVGSDSSSSSVQGNETNLANSS